ncbi:hypothetical protein DDZ13_08275 [Coraliomargarita sinensis]|uniref:Cytochrome C Planctomycete-type domain-containing protein n=1 Tax=Coraliomargarita sinensis TaxID=2174842 RepID=A0A317ZKZ8_9BACT|nr:c-type cytochrome domain-containing protein [Coraliomargarita sinensis]PXA04031.1 hypothetical protein DDZ13_08275 [Coraliomargarita sinensis]
MDFISFLGRLHPVVLHLPIGALFTVIVAEIWLLRSTQRKDQLLLFVLYLFTLLTAVLAIATGLILHEEDAYGGSTLDLHEKLGIATGVVMILLAGCAYVAVRMQSKHSGLSRWVTIRRLGLFVSTGLITVTGHYGGELTHGRGFLFEYGPAFLRESTKVEPVEITAEITAFDAAIHPIIENYCVYCHDDETTKGKLRMDSPEAMLAGGSTGPLFVAGDTENSLMLERIHLPDDHEDHMPPIEKRQPSEEEIAALTWWIESGASFDMKLSDPQVPESVQAVVPGDEPVEEEPKISEELDLEAVQELRDQLLTIQRIQQGDNRLWVSFSAIATTAGDDFILQLRPLANFVTWLDLARTQITDASMSELALMKNLEQLNLNACDITDEGIKQLEGLDNLKDLNLAETPVSEASLPTLIQLDSLETVHLFGTGWTAEGAEVFRRIRPDVTVNIGE